MRLAPDKNIHLTYCMNVHPGTRVEDIHAAIGGPAATLARRVAGGQPFGLGLRMAEEATRALEAPDTIQRLHDLMAMQGVYAFTVNAFPYAAFHETRVKEKVYAPDWRHPDRGEYTRRVARLLARLLPEGQEGSISTVPGSFREWIKDDADIDQMAAELARVALTLSRLQEESGGYIHLGLEPEPCCFLETTEEFLAFFKNRILFKGARLLAYESGCTRSAAENLLRAHLGLCLDTCHLAIQGENLASSVCLVQAEGILISKVQLSAALRCRDAVAFREQLPAFDDGVYLHQVVARNAQGRRLAYTDLPEAISRLPPDAGDIRIHFHVPLYWKGDERLGTTRDALTDEFRNLLLAGASPHIEIETYTFDVMPTSLTDARPIEDHLEAEWRQVVGWLGYPRFSLS